MQHCSKSATVVLVRSAKNQSTTFLPFLEWTAAKQATDMNHRSKLQFYMQPTETLKNTPQSSSDNIMSERVVS